MKIVTIVHIADKTTEFLRPISDPYTDIQRYVTHTNEAEYEQLLEISDRIIMLGHGSRAGLFGSHSGYAIDKNMVKYLKGKENIYIWCNADQFVKEHGLQGFYTGMFISEPLEAHCFNVPAENYDIELSNTLFATSVAVALADREYTNRYDILAEVKDNYRSEDNAVIKYNAERLYYNPPNFF